VAVVRVVSPHRIASLRLPGDPHLVTVTIPWSESVRSPAARLHRDGAKVPLRIKSSGEIAARFNQLCGVVEAHSTTRACRAADVDNA
jgi:hypothetical protein